MAAEQYCLKWNNHQSTLLVNFETLLESNVLTDCTLSADGKYLNVHRVVLSACSPYFYKLLGEHRDKHPIFFMKDTSYDELKGIVDYMYKGEVNIDQDKIESFLSTAKSLQIKGLADEDGGSAAKEDDEGLPRSKRKPPDLVDSPLPDESPRSPKRKRRPRPPSQDSAQDQNNHCDIPPVTYQPPPPPAPQPEITMPTPMMPVKKTEPIETHSGFSQVQLKTEQIEEPQDDVQDLTLDDDEEEYGAGDESQQAGTSFSESSQDMKWFQQMTNQSVMSDDSFMASASTQNVTNNTGTPGSQGADDVCYDGVGCFSQSEPWVSVSRPLPPPVSPEKVNVRIYLYTRKENKRFNVKLGKPLGLNGSDFKVRKTVLMTHGFASNGNTTWLDNLKNAYLKAEDVNVFIVDWGDGAADTNYLQVASNTRVVGAVVGRFATQLVKGRKIKPGQLHFLGHSLGSHVMGYTSKNLVNNTAPAKATAKEKEAYRPRRITGMDPAQPGFENEPPEVRLNKEDANYVDIIHSDAKPFVPVFGFGFISPLGDTDFYLNSGSNQPGCTDTIPIDNVKGIDDLKNIPVEVLSNAVACSHGRAYEVFTSAIDPSVDCQFQGRRISNATIPGVASVNTPIIAASSCGKSNVDCVNMGLESIKNKNRDGSFQVRTSKMKPYCCDNYSDVFGCQ